MRVRKNILVLDTETVGDFSTPLIHDFAYCILDENFNIVKTYNALVNEIKNCKYLMRSDFYNTKKSLYDFMILQKKVELKNWLDILKDFKNDLKDYNIKTICAYNVAFDKRAIEKTCELLHGKIPKLNYLCIWNLATDTIMNNKKYKKWCIDNNYISDKGNFLTNAECCYQYITNNIEFIEEHTALQDSIIESEILKYIMENYKGCSDYGAKYNCWQKVQE